MKLVKGHKYLRRGSDVVPYSPELAKAAGGDWAIFIPANDIVKGEQLEANTKVKPAVAKNPDQTLKEAEEDAKKDVAKKVEKVATQDIRTEMSTDLNDGVTMPRQPEPAGGPKKVVISQDLSDLT